MRAIGARGTVPEREEDLARPRVRKGGDQVAVTKGELWPVTIPEPDSEWHPIALMLWEGLKTSGQSQWYQNSDWAMAYSLCEDLSAYKSPQVKTDKFGNPILNKDGDPILAIRRSGQMLQTIYSAMSSLLVTEGDRRRVRLELHAPEEPETPASVHLLAEYRESLGLDD